MLKIPPHQHFLDPPLGVSPAGAFVIKRAPPTSYSTLWHITESVKEFDTPHHQCVLLLGKTIVHEWAHYRWGVFEELPGVLEPRFYLDSGKIEANK